MNTSEDTGKLILRLALGLLILLHGVSKIIGGIDPIVGLVVKAGLPASVAYLVYIGEVLAPVMMIVGVWTRAAGVVIAINMVVAVMLAHAHQVFTLSKTGGWALERQGMFFFAALAVALLGAGRLSMGGIHGRLN
jgi:putative oxidoreductase